MFRMIFDQHVVENVEEHFSVCAHAYAGIDLHMQLASMHTRTLLIHTHAIFMRSHLCSSVYTDT